MNEHLLKTSSKPEHNNMTDNNNNSNQNKYKAYLIEKLLNESSKSKVKEMNNELKANGESNLKKSESKEDDVASEAGTYTVDEANDIANAADFNEDPHHRQTNENHTHTAEPKKTNSTTNELVNARAAINEVFGVVQRPKIDPLDAQPNGSDDTRKANVKRQPSKTSRTRNQTYSLGKELPEGQTADNNNSKAATTNDHVNNSSYSTSSSSISSCSVDNHANRMKKTMTYEVLSQNGEQCDKTSLDLDKQTGGQSTMNTSLNMASARTVGTELLLGDTEKLIEQLRKSKRNTGSASKKRTSNLNGSLSSASSTNSCHNLPQTNELNSVRTSQSWTVASNALGNDDYQAISSTRATIDFDVNKKDDEEDDGDEDPNDPFTNT